MRCIFDNSGRGAAFLAQMIPSCRERGLPEDAVTILVLDNDGYAAGGMAYHGYDPDARVIEISGAAVPGSGWLTRTTLWTLYAYPFLTLNCQMVVQRTSARDERLLRQLAAYNYSFINVPRLFGRDHDAVLCLLTREAWDANKFNRARRKQGMSNAVFAEG